MNAVVESVAEPIRLDIGCGINKKKGFIGIDRLKFDGVDINLNAGTEKLPYDDDSVEEIHTSHFLEHLKAMERIHFVNECHRVLKKDAKLTIVVPHWGSNRAYGDMTHQWPPVSEMWFYYLDKSWRKVNAPHNDAEHLEGGYTCDFLFTFGYSMHPSLISRNPEYQQFALQNYKESAMDIIATLSKR